MRTLEAFAGAGGAALGLRAAGFSSIACLEWDKDAAATLAAAGFPAIHGDVRAYTPTERPDLLWASPPCQAWSSAGKRGGATDERNGWPWTFDLCDRARPTWMVCENVPGLTMHSGEANCDRAGSEPIRCPGCYWLAVILPEARRRFAVVEWRVLDAASFGVPQRRHRVFLVCGPTAIRWPEPTHADPDTLRQGSMFGPKLQPWRTVRQALGIGLETIGQTSPATAKGGNLWRSADAPSVTIPELTTSGGWNGVHARIIGGGSNPRGKDAAHERTYRDLTDEPSTTVAAEQIGNAGPFVLDAPMPTMSAGGHANGRSAVSANAHTRRMFDAAGIRRLTVAECATLQDFPPDHPWQGTQTSRYRQVGNAVPPTLARVVGEAVMRANGVKR